MNLLEFSRLAAQGKLKHTAQLTLMQFVILVICLLFLYPIHQMSELSVYCTRGFGGILHGFISRSTRVSPYEIKHVMKELKTHNILQGADLVCGQFNITSLQPDLTDEPIDGHVGHVYMNKP